MFALVQFSLDGENVSCGPCETHLGDLSEWRNRNFPLQFVVETESDFCDDQENYSKCVIIDSYHAGQFAKLKGKTIEEAIKLIKINAIQFRTLVGTSE